MIRFTALSILGSMIVAFVVTGLLSVIRLAVRLHGNAGVTNSEWLASSLEGSLGWWFLTAGFLFLLVFVTRKLLAKAG